MPETTRLSKVGVSETVIVAMLLPACPVAIILFPLKSNAVTVPDVPMRAPSSKTTMASRVPTPVELIGPQSQVPEPSATGT